MARLTNALRAHARADLAGGMSLDAAMEKYGITKSAAYYLSATRQPESRVQVPDDILRAISSGDISAAEAARAAGVSASAVYQRIRKIEQEPRKYTQIRDAAGKVARWSARGYSVRKIMERTGLSRAQVQRIRQKIRRNK